MKTADERICESIHIVKSMLADFSEKRASSVYSFFDPKNEGSAFVKNVFIFHKANLKKTL
jgi:arginyl-tRNA--protein-N-Asp/Glu arginylyltransferase